MLHYFLIAFYYPLTDLVSRKSPVLSPRSVYQTWSLLRGPLSVFTCTWGSAEGRTHSRYITHAVCAAASSCCFRTRIKRWPCTELTSVLSQHAVHTKHTLHLCHKSKLHCLHCIIWNGCVGHNYFCLFLCFSLFCQIASGTLDHVNRL